VCAPTRAVNPVQLPSETLEALYSAAASARACAHAPYSKFPVGAALLGADGRIFGGCNVENASFGLTLCAERGALARAIADGARQFRALALVGGGSRLLTPCGACRQALHEFAPELAVYSRVLTDRGTGFTKLGTGLTNLGTGFTDLGTGFTDGSWSLRALLPDAMDAQDLPQTPRP